MRRNDHDVTDRVRTTDAAAVSAEVLNLYHGLYPRAASGPIRRAFEHAVRLYRGRHPAFHACDTLFHDMHHMLEVTLAMARLMDGYERGRARSARVSPTLYSVGVISALFHDVGYLRRRSDRRHGHGAEYTLTHVGRSARFLSEYLRDAGLARYAPAGAAMVHYTGHERPAEAIRIDGALPRRIGQMLGTADLIGQMSDRCYLEKRRDRLYAELVAGGSTCSSRARIPTPNAISADRTCTSKPCRRTRATRCSSCAPDRRAACGARRRRWRLSSSACAGNTPGGRWSAR